MNTSHGSRCITATNATRRGLRVTADANHGYTIVPIPSPRLEIEWAPSNLKYERPRRGERPPL